MLKKEKPRVYQNDTTFGTHSNKTDMWEIAGLIFLSAETKEKVDNGMKLFQNALISSDITNTEPLIFFVDKDFD